MCWGWGGGGLVLSFTEKDQVNVFGGEC
jgi:hypothetical protein